MNVLAPLCVNYSMTTMKTLKMLLLVGFCSAGAAQAQEGPVGPPPQEVYFVPSVVYEQPVVYEAPVVYEMPVVYMAPVTYGAPAPAGGPCQSCQPPCIAPSTVVVIGAGGGPYGYSTCGNSCSSVIHFGCGQAASQGYQFNRPR
jgi:hypothetical protein